MILPGATLGMLGGGQLGRMFTIAARTLGFQVMVLDPDPHSPAGELATSHIRADFHDPAALACLAQGCAAVTTEFENVPADSLRVLAERCVVRPAPEAVAVLQDRIREKSFLREHGFPTVPFAAVRTSADLTAADRAICGPGVLKVSRFGYDGKGQVNVVNRSELDAAFRQLGHEPCVLERRVDLRCELSVVLARGADGASAVFPVAENQHRNGILDITLVPARVPANIADEAIGMARGIAERLDYVGVLAVEFFLTHDGELAVNEIAPRPHNSGHYTLDACITSQFEQQVRAICGLPLGAATLLSPVVMVNILGDQWANGTPAWERLLAQPRLKLHLYGKREARVGRKMGHFTCLAECVEDALEAALSAQRALQG
jgi:5-(carboxyamino)imidazole ribonucleotide synthase